MMLGSQSHMRLMIAAGFAGAALLSGASTALGGGVASARGAGRVIYVDDDAGLDGDGSSWLNAFRFLQDALHLAAQPRSAVSEIHIAQGTYKPDQSNAAPLGSRDRNANFAMLSGVALRGGYLGLSAQPGQDPNQRDPGLYQTILTGDLAGDDGPADFENSEENSYQVVTSVDVIDGTLDGFIVCAGRGDGPGYGATPLSKEQGAGLNIYYGSPHISNCMFRNNWNFNHGAVNDHGDATTFANCTFMNNFAESFGAGLYIHHYCITTVTQCAFLYNSTPGQGGGLYSRSMHEARVSDCYFFSNSATEGAGNYNSEDSTTLISHCIFDSNMATDGAGAYCLQSSPTFTDCTMVFNEADEGAGVFGNGASVTIANCIMNDNIGHLGGGAVWLAGGVPLMMDCSCSGNSCDDGGGAIYTGDGGTPIITRCTLANNIAIGGAGVYNVFADAFITDCTFNDNIVTGGLFPAGGGMENYFCSPTIQRCQFLRNSAELGGGGIYNEGGAPIITDCRLHANFTFGETEGWGGAIMNGYFTHAVIADCEIVGNRAREGGGVFNIVFSQPGLVNCTIAGNSASIDGGGIHNFDSSTVTVVNCLVWDNAPMAIDGAPAAVQRSCIQGGYPGDGNVATDPLIHRLPDPGPDGMWGTDDDDFGDLRVRRFSPCIDSGDDTAVPSLVSVDLSGQARFVDDPQQPDTGVVASRRPVVDMGCYEFQVAGCAADIAPLNSLGRRGDGVVGVDDLLLVLSEWGTVGGVGSADLSPPNGGDGVVNMADLLVVLNAWGICP